MIATILFPKGSQLQLLGAELEGNKLILTISSTAETAICPYCTKVSERVHSRYTRQPADLSCISHQVCLRLQVCRFFCDNNSCTHSTFAERIPILIAPYARRTQRLAERQREVAFEVGGEAGARILAKLAIPTSPDTLIRLVRNASKSVVETPRVLGVDDWAKRKGQSYGTILVDLEKHKAIDLLPDRSAETLIEWLTAHPGIEIISRDRGTEYIKGATIGAPDAIQVADRWHLLKNLRDALEGGLERDRLCLMAAAIKEPVVDETVILEVKRQPVVVEDVCTLSENTPSLCFTLAEEDKDARRIKRIARYEDVKELHQYRLTNKEIAKQLKIDEHTVSLYIKADECPMYPQGRTRLSKLDHYQDYMEKRWLTGCQNATQIWHEIRQLGFSGSRSLVAQWGAKKRKKQSKETESPPKKVVPWTPSRAAWLFIKPESTLTSDDQATLSRMQAASKKASRAYELGQQFIEMIRERQPDKLISWLDNTLKSGLNNLVRFAKGLQRDLAAVTAAMTLPWSNGQTEGQVNKLKFIKRQMYGRANFDLLRKRVLGIPISDQNSVPIT